MTDHLWRENITRVDELNIAEYTKCILKDKGKVSGIDGLLSEQILLS